MPNEPLYDGCMDFLGGQDASHIPDRVPENAYYAGVNVSVKKGSLQPRWGFDKREIKFPTDGILDKYRREHTFREIFESGKFQAATPYYIGSTQYILFVVSGFIFIYNQDSRELLHLEIEGGSHINSRARRINWTAAGKYIVLYDYPDFPVIVEGLSARRADPAKYEIPVSTQGAFNENRLFVVNAGDEFTGGDPVGSIAAPDAPITFKEVILANTGFTGDVYRLPTSDHNDPITYCGFLQFADTSTGIGPLIMASNRAVYSFNTQNPRTAWLQTQFGSLLCYNAGVVGPRAFTNVNSDAFFLSSDGFVRTLSMSRAEQGRWARVPLSREVENWFKVWDKDLLSLSFAASFQNKVFFSVNPYRTKAIDYSSYLPISDYAFGGMAVLELDNYVVDQIGNASKPSWAGLWTGVRPMDMVTLPDKAFVIAKDEGVNSIFEINPDTNQDTKGAKTRFVRSRIYTREHDFKDPFMNKETHSLDVNFDNLKGEFEFEVKYKSSHSPFFFPWRTFKHSIPWQACKPPQDCTVNGFAPHHILNFTLGAPDTDECNPITEEPYRLFKKLQLVFTITAAYFEIHEYRIKAVPKPKPLVESICDPFPSIPLCEQCTDDWAIPDWDICQT